MALPDLLARIQAANGILHLTEDECFQARAWLTSMREQSVYEGDSQEQKRYVSCALEYNRPQRSGPTGKTNRDLDEMERVTPKLDTDNGQWIKNKLAAKLEGVEPRTLAAYRQSGLANADNDFGCDRDGRIWRRQGTSKSHPWYLRSTLKIEQSKTRKP